MTKSLTETQLFLEAFKDDEDLSQTLHDLASKYNYLCAEQVHADIECQDTIAEDMQQFPLKAAETLRINSILLSQANKAKRIKI